MNKDTTIDVAPIEEFINFRSDYLHFLRLTNGYIASIFWHVFKKTDNKGQKKRRKEMKECVLTLIEDGKFNEPQNIEHRFIDERKSVSMDCFSGDFQTILKSFPGNLKTAFINKLEQEHAIFISFDDLLESIDNFRKKRNYLEHFGNNATINFDEKKVLEDLGVFLLPELLHLFLGCISRYHRKLPPNEHSSFVNSKENIRSIIEDGIKKRKQNTKKLYDEVLTRNNKNIHKSRRKALSYENASWYIYYKGFSSKQSDYRPSQFRLQYYFIGQDNIEKLQKLLSKNTDAKINFRTDIKPLYMLITKIDLILHRFIEQYKEIDEEEANKEAKEKGFGRKKRQSFVKKLILEKSADIKIIRNHIAHNAHFYNIPDKPPMDVFSTMINAINIRPFLNKRELINDLSVQILQLLKKEKYALVCKDCDCLEAKVSKWTKENRDEYKKDSYKVDMRRSTARIAAKWYKDMKNALNTYLENDKKGCS